MLIFLQLLLAFINFTKISDALLEQSEAGTEFLKISGQILPEGTYRVEARPFRLEQKSSDAKWVTVETEKGGKFKMELPMAHFNGAIYNEIQITPIYEQENAMNKRQTVKRLLSEPFSEAKIYTFYYGAVRPTNKDGLNRWYLHGLIMNPPPFLDRWDQFNDTFQPIQVTISGQQICGAQSGPIVSRHHHIQLAKVPWWMRPFARGTPFRVDLSRMAEDAECGARIDQIGYIEEVQIRFEAIPGNTQEEWKEGSEPASYTIRYPVLSGIDQRGREFEFEYELSFFRQTEELEGIQKTGDGPKHLVEAWNGLMERAGTLKMGILEMQEKGENIQQKNWQNDVEPVEKVEKNDTDKTRGEMSSVNKGITDLSEEDIAEIIEDSVERQTFTITEEETPSKIAKSVLAMTQRLCGVLTRSAGLLAFAFEGICARLVRKCELCAMTPNERAIQRKEIDAEKREIGAEMDRLIGELDRAGALRRFFENMWGAWGPGRMAQWLRELAHATATNARDKWRVIKSLRAIFGAIRSSEQTSMSTEQTTPLNMHANDRMESEETIFPEDHLKRAKREDDDNNEYGTFPDATLPLRGRRDCEAIRTMAQLCDKSRFGRAAMVGDGDWGALRRSAERNMRTVVAASGKYGAGLAQLLWSDAREAMARVGRRVLRSADHLLRALKALRTRQMFAFTIFGAGMALMIDFIRNTTIRSVRIPVKGFTKTFHNVKWDWQVESYKRNYSDSRERWKYRQDWVRIDHMKDLWVDWPHEETVSQIELSKQFWTVALVTGTVAVLLMIWISTASCF